MSKPAKPTFAPDWEAFETEIGTVPRLPGSMPEIGASFSGFVARLASRYSFDLPPRSATSTDIEVPATSTTPPVPIRIYRPLPPPCGQKQVDGPVVIFFHGGGWCVGDINTDDPDPRAISTRTGLVVVSVEYRLAPANPYPAGLDDSVAAAKWVLESDLVRPSSNSEISNGIILTGLSAGGNLAIGTALRLIDDEPALASKIVGVLPQVPVTIDPELMPADVAARLGPHTSYEVHGNDTINSDVAMRAFFDAYAPPAGDVYTNVLLHPRLGDLPPTSIIAAELDTLYDDSRLFFARLREEGVPTQLNIRHGYPHYYWTFPAPVLQNARESYRLAVDDAVAWLLAQRKTTEKTD